MGGFILQYFFDNSVFCSQWLSFIANNLFLYFKKLWSNVEAWVSITLAPKILLRNFVYIQISIILVPNILHRIEYWSNVIMSSEEIYWRRKAIYSSESREKKKKRYFDNNGWLSCLLLTFSHISHTYYQPWFLRFNTLF